MHYSVIWNFSLLCLMWLEVRIWCDDKCLSPKVTSCGVQVQETLQIKLGVRLPTMISPRCLQKMGALCTRYDIFKKLKKKKNDVAIVEGAQSLGL